MTTAQGDALTALDVMLDRGELLVQQQQLQRPRRRRLQSEVKTDASESVLPLPETRDMVVLPGPVSCIDICRYSELGSLVR
ncbi:hypothetical protein P3T27_000084 [Kitasatospora sp. MAA19]|uniref:hypothetical protein n=1 Tax=Kitasatospora sp. MAA19 TaxID=3035090 RepID=UPI002474273B|nr:hypothetical protein [Kitasatospora sp. MAA19]MDH6703403.1 hypothetical protein [Kitasatospora sp. MAA19]